MPYLRQVCPSQTPARVALVRSVTSDHVDVELRLLPYRYA